MPRCLTKSDTMNFTPEELLNSSPVCIISTKNREGEHDAMVTTSSRFVSLDPKLLSFSISKDRYTLKNLNDTREFTVNIPGENLLEGLWSIGTQSFTENKDKVKDSGLKTKKSNQVEPPLIKKALSSFECKVRDLLEVGDHYLVIGKIVATNLGSEGYPLYHLGGKRFLSQGRVVEVGVKREPKREARKGEDFPYTEE